MEEKHMDLRVKRTLKSIQDAFYELVQEQGLNHISITDLTQRAGINRKTFYLHYNSMKDLLNVVMDESYRKIMDVLEPCMVTKDVGTCISRFYHYLYECEGIQRILLCDPNNKSFYKEVMTRVIQSDACKKLYAATEYPDITAAYAMSLSNMYWEWKNNPEISLDELIDYATRIVTGGYTAVLARK